MVDTEDWAAMSIIETRLPAGGATLAALRTQTKQPRATILALHGGGYDARYWHHPGSPATSLLEAGAALGFEVIAVDRPGNAQSRDSAPDGASVAEQVDRLFALIDEAVDPAQPVFLVGHSLGGIIGLTMTADPRSRRLAGIETAGTPVRFDEMGRAMLRENIANMRQEGAPFMPKPTRDLLKGMFFGPSGRFDPEVVAWGPTEHGAPVIEVEGVLAWLETHQDILPRITIPVHWTFARHEVSSLFDEETQPRLAELLAGNPLVRWTVEEETAHNISLHHIGRAYHLRVLAFCEEVLALNHR